MICEFQFRISAPKTRHVECFKHVYRRFGKYESTRLIPQLQKGTKTWFPQPNELRRESIRALRLLPPYIVTLGE